MSLVEREASGERDKGHSSLSLGDTPVSTAVNRSRLRLKQLQATSSADQFEAGTKKGQLSPNSLFEQCKA